ncbi:MAG TPA: hypothetical protein VFC82_06925 [Actinomycetaceae bacterium]|nr:hypothetical protein [Actinomycetaceae bacterium]
MTIMRPDVTDVRLRAGRGAWLVGVRGGTGVRLSGDMTVARLHKGSGPRFGHRVITGQSPGNHRVITRRNDKDLV